MTKRLLPEPRRGLTIRVTEAERQWLQGIAYAQNKTPSTVAREILSDHVRKARAEGAGR